jgi:hypothetical protein
MFRKVDLMAPAAQQLPVLVLNSSGQTVNSFWGAQPPTTSPAASSTSGQVPRVEVINTPFAAKVMTVNVYLPKEMLAMSQSLRFELPESVKAVFREARKIVVMIKNGAGIPS